MANTVQIYPKIPSPCTCMNIRRASRAVTQFYDEALQPCGLSIAQMSLLTQLTLAGSVTISELAKRMRIDRTTLNRNMKPLTEAGLITVSPGKDSRTRQVSLTDSGRQSHVQARTLWQEAQIALDVYLGQEDAARLVDLLNRLEALAP